MAAAAAKNKKAKDAASDSDDDKPKKLEDSPTTTLDEARHWYHDRETPNNDNQGPLRIKMQYMDMKKSGYRCVVRMGMGKKDVARRAECAKNVDTTQNLDAQVLEYAKNLHAASQCFHLDVDHWEHQKTRRILLVCDYRLERHIRKECSGNANAYQNVRLPLTQRSHRVLYGIPASGYRKPEQCPAPESVTNTVYTSDTIAPDAKLRFLPDALYYEIVHFADNQEAKEEKRKKKEEKSDDEQDGANDKPAKKKQRSQSPPPTTVTTITRSPPTTSARRRRRRRKNRTATRSNPTRAGSDSRRRSST